MAIGLLARCLSLSPGQPRRAVTRFDSIDVHLIDRFVYSQLMDMIQKPERVLLYESEGPVRERACALLASDGIAVCATGNPALFRELAEVAEFDVLMARVRASLELG